MRYNSVLDLHTHTLVSGHAYCSLREMAKAASKKGLEVLGITEHAPAMPGTCHKFYLLLPIHTMQSAAVIRTGFQSTHKWTCFLTLEEQHRLYW